MDKNKSYTDRELLLLNIQATENITLRLDKLEQIFVTKAESEALKSKIEDLSTDVKNLEMTTTKEIDRLKGKKVVKETVLWVGLVASAIINILVIYNLFTKE